ncbi:MAG: NAD(+)/NADH kinase [Pygmaiobacter massiliensis]|nr:NAD(+)/NADH kinase [Pygmaiobacter massiliensis]
MNVYFAVNEQKPTAWEVALQAARLLRSNKVNCFLSADAPRPTGQLFHIVATEKEAAEQSDAIITVGGDGTLLHTVARLGPQCPPILGINVGRMGFLATVEPANLEPLNRLATGDYMLDERSMLEARIAGKPMVYTALNDVVISKSEVNATIRCTVYCDSTPVSSYRGDGVIVATPTGSTAYSLSAGGPVVDARSNGMVVTAISPHSLNTPPMVFAGERQLKIEICENSRRTACFSSDGTNEIRLEKEDVVYVRQSPYKIRLVCLNEAEQLKSIDKKLKGR